MSAEDEPSRKIGSRWFNANKLDRSKNRDGSFYVDGSDTMANKGFVIDITHVPSGRQLFFKAFIESYTETYSPDWAEETVYGRMDPIYQFKNTTRTLTLALKIPAASESEAYENLAKVQALAQFLYPNYLDVGSATTIAQSPILRLGVMNLGRSQNQFYNPTEFPSRQANPYTGPAGATDDFGGYFNTRARDSGLLGILSSLTINHNLAGDVGVIERSAKLNSPGSPAEPVVGGSVLPKLIEINFDFKVIHEHPLGWDQEGNFSNEAFPYGTNFEGSGPADANVLKEEDQARLALTRARQRQMEEEENREIAEQALANAEARYSGIFGERRQKRDRKALTRGRASEEQISALAGAFTSENRAFEGDHTDATDTALYVDQLSDMNASNQGD